MTQKNQQDDSSDSDEEQIAINGKSDNPWLAPTDEKDSLDQAFSGYKKFWEEKNSNEKALQKLKKMTSQIAEEETKQKFENNEENSEKDKENNISTSKNSSWIEEDLDDDDDDDNVESASSDDENPSTFINDLFDEVEGKINDKMESKLKELKPKLLESLGNKPKVKANKNKKTKKRKIVANDPRYLEFAREAQLGDIDEALHEGNDPDKEEKETIRPTKRLKDEINEIKAEKKSFMRGTTDEIDPQSFLSVKSKHLLTAVPKTQEFGDMDEVEFENIQSSNKMSLAEAFENDDIINDFVDEVDEEAKHTKGNESMGILPGWGSWEGAGIKKSKKIKQFEKPHIKKKDRVIVNTTPNEKLRKHLVSKIPFPFTTIKDFEASMRLPIGKDFVPASAHNKLTVSSIVTKAGAIIEPMSEDVLIENESSQKKTMKNKRKMFKGRK